MSVINLVMKTQRKINDVEIITKLRDRSEKLRVSIGVNRKERRYIKKKKKKKKRKRKRRSERFDYFFYLQYNETVITIVCFSE